MKFWTQPSLALSPKTLNFLLYFYSPGLLHFWRLGGLLSNKSDCNFSVFALKNNSRLCFFGLVVATIKNDCFRKSLKIQSTLTANLNLNYTIFLYKF